MLTFVRQDPMMRQLLFWLLLSTTAFAQYSVSGVVLDSENRRPLAFATLTAGETQTIADVDGKFVLQTKQAKLAVTISYTGYQPQKVEMDAAVKFYTITLKLQDERLDNVVVGKDPSAAIMAAVVRLRMLNDPRQKLSSFRFSAYNNLVITANPDSITTVIDSVYALQKQLRVFSKLDSSNYKFNRLISRRHLFQTEKVSRFEYAGGRLKETIIGTRMAGFRQPLYELIGFHLQSFSVYDDRYELLETQYESPVTARGLSDYRYLLLDTITYGGRQVFTIHFKPKRNRKAGLQGLLYVDSRNYAVAKAVMRVRNVLDVTATQESEFVAEQQIWFPVSRKFRIVKGRNSEDITILGETLKFDADGENGSVRARQASDYTYLLSESRYFDAEYNIPLRLKKPSIAMQISEQAIRRDTSFWKMYRNEVPDVRSEATYRILDSLARKEKIEKKLRIGRKVLNGYVPIGPLDADLRHLLSYNNYEGFRLGLGGVTNDRFSSIYKIEAYSAYGTRDGSFKYNLGGAVRIGNFSNTWIGGAYTDDVREIGSTSFAVDKRVFKIYDPRPINVSTFYGYMNWRAYVETRIIPKTESIWQLTHSRIDPKFEYIFSPGDVFYERYTITTAMASIQWNPFSEYMQTPSGRLEIEKRFPRFTFQVTKTLPDILQNDFDYSKFDVRGEYEKQYLNGQKTSFLVEAGYATGDVPLTHLYNTSPNNLTKDRMLQRITFAGKNSFETMYFNEFFSSEYVLFQIKHTLKRIALFRKVKPSLVFVNRMAWGDMKQPERHIGVNYKTLNDGYFESGIELNKIYKGLGLSGFYRYGPNHLPQFEDNISVKISFMLDLGF